jgi:Ferritin-like domain
MAAPSADPSATSLPSPSPSSITSRRAFLGGAGAVALGAGVLGGVSEAFGKGDLTHGDAAILRFLSAAEILETDLWQQYNELCGIQDAAVPGGGGNPAFAKIMATFDDDMARYVHDNTHDEMTHFTFLNGYLRSRGAEPVNLDAFRKLPSSKATGAQQIGRLTNLMALTMDTSWYTRYRAHRKNPDLGASFPPAIPGLLKGAFPAIPRSDADLKPAKHLQAIANTAAFHFATIEQGGTSLYPSLAQRVKDPEVLQVVLSIGPTETMHFQTWSDIAGDSPPVKIRPTAWSSPTSTNPRSAAPTTRRT